MNKITRSQLETIISKSVQFGSRPLGVNSENSDFDFAILEKDLPEFDYVLEDPKKYFNVLPEHSKLIINYEVNNKKMDILVLTHQKDLDVVKNTIEDLKKVPKYLLRIKYIRVDLYEKALLHYGWKPADNIPDNIKLENKHRYPVEIYIDIDEIPF